MYLDVDNVDFYHSSDILEKKPINRKIKYFNCGNTFLEVKNGLFLYTDSKNNSIFKLDLSKTKITRKIFHEHPERHNNYVQRCGFDMMSISQYYPENLYFVVNIRKSGGGEDILKAEFYCFNIEKFIKGNKEPLYMIDISKSQNIYGFCEYDKKYILLDSYVNGIYIIDIELKQKVAVSVPKIFYKEVNKYLNIYSDRKAGGGILYKKIYKLKDGQVLIRGNIIDIREQKGEYLLNLIEEFVFLEDHIYIIGPSTTVCSYKLYQKGEK